MKDSSLEARIQHLERQLKAQRWLMVGLLMAVLVIAGIGAATSDASNEIKTKRLIVVNDKGEQAVLMTSEKDGGVIALFNGQGLAPVLVAGGSPSGGEVLLTSSGEANLIELSGDKGNGRVSVSVGGSMHQLSEPSAK